MKIGVTGCSHSSYNWGNPWHHFMGIEYNSEIVQSSSPGAGNEMNFEKMRFIVENNNLDYFVFQLTDPNRLVLGINNWVVEHDGNRNQMLIQLENKMIYQHGNLFKDLSFYTFNAHKNDQNLERIFEKKFNVDEFMINHVMMSTYNLEYKVFMTMMSIKYICDFYNVPVIFFSWFVDILKLSKKTGYINILEKFNIVPGSVLDFINENKIKSIPNDSHYDGDGHYRIFHEYLNPYFKKIINK